MAITRSHWSNVSSSALNRYATLRRPGLKSSLSSYASSLARKTESAEDSYYDDAYEVGSIDFQTYLDHLNGRVQRPYLTPLQRETLNQKIRDVNNAYEESKVYTAYKNGGEYQGQKVDTNFIYDWENAKLSSMQEGSTAYNSQLTKVNNLQKSLQKEYVNLEDSKVKLAYQQGGYYNGQKVDDNFMAMWERSKLDLLDPGTAEYMQQEKNITSWEERAQTSARRDYRIARMNQISQMPEDTSEQLKEKAKLYQELEDMAKKDGDLNEALQYETTKNNYITSANNAAISDVFTNARLGNATGSGMAGGSLPTGGGIQPTTPQNTGNMGGSMPMANANVPQTPQLQPEMTKAVQSAQNKVNSLAISIAKDQQMLAAYQQALPMASGDKRTQLEIGYYNLINSLQDKYASLQEAQTNLQKAQITSMLPTSYEESNIMRDLGKKLAAGQIPLKGNEQNPGYLDIIYAMQKDKTDVLQQVVNSDVLDYQDLEKYQNNLDLTMQEFRETEYALSNPSEYALVVDDSKQGNFKLTPAYNVNRNDYIPDVLPNGTVIYRKIYSKEMYNDKGLPLSFKEKLNADGTYVINWSVDSSGKLKKEYVTLNKQNMKSWESLDNGQLPPSLVGNPIIQAQKDEFSNSMNQSTAAIKQAYESGLLSNLTDINGLIKEQQANMEIISENKEAYESAKLRIGTEKEMAGDRIGVQAFEALKAATEQLKNTVSKAMNTVKTGADNYMRNYSTNSYNQVQGVFDKVSDLANKFKRAVTGFVKNIGMPEIYSYFNPKPVMAAESAYQNKPIVGHQGFVEGTPEHLKELIGNAGAKHGIPTNILSALLKQESGFSEDVISGKRVSSAGAQGIAQFMPETAKRFGIDPLNVAQAIDAAAKYLKMNLDRFGSMELALAAYNAGEGNVQKYDGIPPFKETQNYVKSISAMAGGVQAPQVSGATASAKQREYPLYLPNTVNNFANPLASSAYQTFPTKDPNQKSIFSWLSNILPMDLLNRAKTYQSEEYIAPGDYIVRPGDTLEDIALKAGVPVDDIKNLSGLTHRYLQPGQKLTIPTPPPPPDYNVSLPSDMKLNFNTPGSLSGYTPDYNSYQQQPMGSGASTKPPTGGLYDASKTVPNNLQKSGMKINLSSDHSPNSLIQKVNTPQPSIIDKAKQAVSSGVNTLKNLYNKFKFW
jgi:LysM repeat protein